MVLFKQLTGIGSPGLYPLASSGLINGCCPLTALERATQNEESASSTNRQEVGLEDMVCSEEESKEMEEAGILCGKHVQLLRCIGRGICQVEDMRCVACAARHLREFAATSQSSK
jgi:hypothetical protein